MDAGVGRKRTGDGGHAGRPIKHVFGRLIVIADFKGAVDVEGRDA